MLVADEIGSDRMGALGGQERVKVRLEGRL